MSNSADAIAKMIIEAARQNTPRLANEQGIVLNDSSNRNIEQGLINALSYSKSEYAEDPEIRTILKEQSVVWLQLLQAR